MDTEMSDTLSSAHLQIPQEQAASEGNAVQTTDKVPKVKLLSLEEFDRLYPIRPSPATTGNYGFDSKPVPLPLAPANSEAVAKFNHLCQSHSFLPLYTFEEVAKGWFSARVEFNGQACEEQGPFTSKKMAKEAVAQRALLLLQNVELPEKGKQQTSKLKPKLPTTMEENWIGILNHFAQVHKNQLQFQFFEANTRAEQLSGASENLKQFSCTLQLPARPLHTFGSEDSLHSTKADAKRSVAKEAVIWLRTVELLPESTIATAGKRRKSTDEGEADIAKTSSLTSEQSPAAAVHNMSVALGFSQPQFDMKPYVSQDEGPHKLNFYVCTATYLEQDVQREPRLRGPLCQTPPVFGQKSAKQMCCQALLGVLEQIAAERKME